MIIKTILIRLAAIWAVELLAVAITVIVWKTHERLAGRCREAMDARQRCRRESATPTA